MSPELVTLDCIQAAARRLERVICRTPLLPVTSLGAELGAEVRFKCESLQRTGSFKIRGAFNTLSQLDPNSIRRGVVAYSSGNHGQGVALAARLNGTHAIIVTPLTAVRIKIEGIKRYGGEIIREGYTSLERRVRAEAIARERGLPLVPGFDHPHTIAGQGTIGLEILRSWPEVDTVLVPIGGGGLIAGIATAMKHLARHVRVIGVEPEGAPSMRAALDRGAPLTLDATHTLADGLAAVRVSDLTLSHARAFVDDVVLVSEETIREAARYLLQCCKLVVEFSGAAVVGAMLTGAVAVEGRRTAAVLSGGNIDPAAIRSLLLEA